jgi:8-oxo-dGTP diphosphatase
MNARKMLYPLVVVDVALFSIDTEGLKVLLVKRSHAPAQGLWSLPGGILRPEVDDSLEAAARRVLRQKVSVEVPYLSEVRSFSGPDRDPRGWSIGMLFYALLPRDQVHAIVKDSVDEVEWVQADGHGRELAFDHAQQLGAALKALRDKVESHALPLHLMPAEFTLGALQKCCEAILGRSLDKSSFRRRLKEGGDPAVVALGCEEKTGAHRPSRLYRAPDDFAFDTPVKSADRSQRKDGVRS